MRYKIGDWEFRTENAAKPATQAARALLAWLDARPVVTEALDYGCGKLRYVPALTQRCKQLTLVDSAIQLNRTQRLFGAVTTVMVAAASLPNTRVLSTEEFQGDAQRYDFILCANVLSAIPIAQVRSDVLYTLSKRLQPAGRCLFVTQYRNSYFKAISAAPHAVAHLDGWIVRGLHGYAYYGILPKAKLEQLVVAHGMTVIQAWHDGQSAFVLAGRSLPSD